MTTEPPPDPDRPSWATEPVELVAPDPAWQERGHRAARSLEAALGEGWHYVPPELGGRPHQRFFVQVIDGHRAAQLHLLLTGSPHREDLLDFRDALRGDPTLSADYAALKARLAGAHRHDRERYTAAKHDFVAGVLRGRQPSGES